MDLKLATEIYNHGYMMGHEDTVESGYTHVCREDSDSYHSDIVAELLADLTADRIDPSRKLDRVRYCPRCNAQWISACWVNCLDCGTKLPKPNASDDAGRGV